MTSVRILSALVAISAVVGVIHFGGYTGLSFLCFFGSAIALREFSRMTLKGDRYKMARSYFLVLGLVAFSISTLRNDLILHSFVLSTLIIFILFLFMARDESVPLEELVNKAGLCLLGILYAGVCPVYLSLLAKLSDHLEWFAFTFFVIFSGDTAAYFIGRKFGKTRLFLRISPGKSVEGAIGALFASVGVGMALRAFFLPQTDLFLMLILCILTSAVAQIGDLAESMIKRSFDTKDSGSIMPGHGGLLDRIDGILFGAPLVYTFVKFVVLA